MEVFRTKLPVLIKHYRQKAGYTQSQLAEKLDTSLRSFQRFESGEAEPSLEQLYILSKLLSFSVSELFQYGDALGEEQRVLSESDRLLQQSLQIAHVGIFEVTYPDQRVISTQQVGKILELSEDTKFSLELFAGLIADPTVRMQFQSLVQKSSEATFGFSILLNIRTSGGMLKNLDLRIESQFANGKLQKQMGSLIDVTHYKTLEGRLSQALHTVNEMSHLAGFGIWDLQLGSNVLSWTDSLYEIFEIDKKSFSASYEAFLNLVHPEDREKVHNAYTTSIKGQKYYEVEHRLLMPDGRIKWILEKCINYFSSEGQALQSKGYAIDITRWRGNHSQLLATSRDSLSTLP